MLTRLLNLPQQNDLFLFGARATGKSTLLRATLPSESTSTFDLLDTATADAFVGNPSAFGQALLALPSGVRTVVVDEVQKEPRLLDEVQKAMVGGRIRFILTGSSPRKLKRGSANLLAGRAVTRHLFPLTAWERPPPYAFDKQVLRWGSLPKVVLARDDEERKDLLRAYAQTYLAEEIVAEQLVRNLVPFRRFLAVAAQMNGKIVNDSAIARDVGTSHNTVRAYFDILEETLVGFSLPAHHSSVRKRVRAKSKFYLFDPGVARTLSRSLEADLLPGTSAFGDAFEHAVLCEMRALCSYLRPDWELHYLQSASGAEIDVVIDTGVGDPILVGLKSADDISKVTLGSEINLMTDTRASRRVVLSRDPLPKILAPGIEALPWRRGLAEIFDLVS